MMNKDKEYAEKMRLLRNLRYTEEEALDIIADDDRYNAIEADAIYRFAEDPVGACERDEWEALHEGLFIS